MKEIMEPINSVNKIFKAITLREYATILTGCELTKESHGDQVAELADTAYVIPVNPIQRISFLSVGNSQSRIYDIINRFISIHLKTCRAYPNQNCISLGYRSKSMFSSSEIRSLDIECVFVNTGHSFLCTPTWQEVSDILGDRAMHQLFTQALFLPSVNGCYVQVSGTPISEMVRNLNSTKKRQSLYALETFVDDALNISGNRNIGVIELPRFAIFYKFRYDRHLGLPAKHCMTKKVVLKHSLQNEILIFGCCYVDSHVGIEKLSYMLHISYSFF